MDWTGEKQLMETNWETSMIGENSQIMVVVLWMERKQQMKDTRSVVEIELMISGNQLEMQEGRIHKPLDQTNQAITQRYTLLLGVLFRKDTSEA